MVSHYIVFILLQTLMQTVSSSNTSCRHEINMCKYKKIFWNKFLTKSIIQISKAQLSNNQKKLFDLLIILVFYRWYDKWPQSSWLQTAQITIWLWCTLEGHHDSHWAEVKMPAGPCLPGDFREESISAHTIGLQPPPQSFEPSSQCHLPGSLFWFPLPLLNTLLMLWAHSSHLPILKSLVRNLNYTWSLYSPLLFSRQSHGFQDEDVDIFGGHYSVHHTAVELCMNWMKENGHPRRHSWPSTPKTCHWKQRSCMIRQIWDMQDYHVSCLEVCMVSCGFCNKTLQIRRLSILNILPYTSEARSLK